jgi:hypothetical protein
VTLYKIPNSIFVLRRVAGIIVSGLSHRVASRRSALSRLSLAEGERMRSGVPDHEYSFSMEEAEAWLAAYQK